MHVTGRPYRENDKPFSLASPVICSLFFRFFNRRFSVEGARETNEYVYTFFLRKRDNMEIYIFSAGRVNEIILNILRQISSESVK